MSATTGERGSDTGWRSTITGRVLSLTSLDVVPSQAAFESMDSDLAFAWFHWHLMRQPPPLPETLIGSNAGFYLDFLLERWTAVEGAITDEAYREYLRCFSDPETVRASCADYRAIELDLAHDEADRGRRLGCPVLALWGTDMSKRPGWQTGRALDMLTTWRERASDVRGRGIDCGHFLPEEAPEETTVRDFFVPVGARVASGAAMTSDLADLRRAFDSGKLVRPGEGSASLVDVARAVGHLNGAEVPAQRALAGPGRPDRRT